jgi:hypothetical protein
MMMFDKQKYMQTLIARRKPGGGERTMDPTEMKNEVVKTEDGELDGRHLAAQEAIAAMKEGSAEKFMSSMANFMDLHSSMGNKPTPEK